jgi:hypothetical protein
VGGRGEGGGGGEDFVANDNAERRALELTKRLSEEKAKAERKSEELEAHLDIIVIREYEQLLVEVPTHRMTTTELLPSSTTVAPIGPGKLSQGQILVKLGCD